MIKKVIIPAAGAGTRLYPATLYQPKEMLPIPIRGSNNTLQYKPILQVLFEQFYNIGVREYCFVIGRNKRAIIDHFTPDYNSIEKLNSEKLQGIREDLESFYEKLRDVNVHYVIQPEPRGFGDAMLMAKEFAKDEDFWVIAGDTIIVSPDNPYKHFKIMENVHLKYNSAATLSIQTVENPKDYGVVEGEKIEEDILFIRKAIEKPKKPQSNYAITALYIFTPDIFPALKDLRNQKSKEELQLTDGIDVLSKNGVYGVLLSEKERRFDIGNPELYYSSCKELYKLAKKGISVV